MVKSIQLRIPDVLKNECDHHMFPKNVVAAAIQLVGSFPSVHEKAGRTCTVEMKRQDFSIVEGGPETEPSEELPGARDVWKVGFICNGRILA